MATAQWKKSLEIPGRVLFSEGSGDLSRLEIHTAWSNAEVYLHGGHITNFQKKDEPPVLFMSQLSRFQDNSPIRGGIPIIFPWFGPREGHQAHGFARLQEWELREVTQRPSGEVCLRLTLPDLPAAATFPKFSADYVITVGKSLTAELIVTNLSKDQDFTFEDCLHTYFLVGDIGAVSVTGLKGTTYLDQVEKFARKTELPDEIKVTQETDRIYLDTTAATEIKDTSLGRRIRIEKSGSNSTVVWNPWISKSQAMPDFGDDEYKKMICVESGNVNNNKLTLAPGKASSLKIEITTLPL